MSVTAARNSDFNTILPSLLIRPFQTNLDIIQSDHKVSRCTKKGVRHFYTFDVVPRVDNSDETHFMQDTAPQHFGISVRTWLESHSNVRWIGRWGTEDGRPFQTKNTKLSETQIRDIYISAFLEFLQKSCRSVCEMLWPILKSDGKRSEWAVQ
jgi:hypothetical protein